MARSRVLFGHVGTAVFTGVLFGTIFGVIGVSARVIVMAFEYFELYQVILLCHRRSSTWSKTRTRRATYTPQISDKGWFYKT